MADIFISYKREDQSKVHELAKRLESEGWSVWWDYNIDTGERFRNVIQDELTNARCIIVIWSALSLKSRFIIDDAKEGLSKNILIPISFDNSIPPLGFREIQVLNFRDRQNDEEFQRLKNSVQKKIGRSNSGPDPHPAGPKKSSKYFYIGSGVLIVIIMVFVIFNSSKKDQGKKNESPVQDQGSVIQGENKNSDQTGEGTSSNTSKGMDNDQFFEMPSVTGAGANNFYFFKSKSDGNVYYSTGQLGGANSNWNQIQGSIKAGSAPAAGAIGTQVFVAVKGTDNNIYLNQATLGNNFNDSWQSLNFTTDAAPAVVGVQNYIYIFAKKLNGEIFYNRAALGSSFEGWKVVEGNGLAAAGSSPSVGVINNYMYLLIKGTDNNVYLNQGTAGSSFLPSWQSMNFTTYVSPVATGVGNYVYFFAVGTNGKIHYDYSEFQGGGHGWKLVNGDNPTAVSVAAGSVRNDYIFITIKGNDKNVYLNQGGVLGSFQDVWQPVN